MLFVICCVLVFWSLAVACFVICHDCSVMLVVALGLLFVACCSLVVGCWLLVVCSLLLVVGGWLLDIWLRVGC